MRERIIVFGLGNSFKRFFMEYDSETYQIVAFSDNKNKIGEYIQSLPIIEPESINKFNYDSIMVTSNIYFAEIKEQLLNYHIKDEKIKCYNALHDYEDKIHCRDVAKKMFKMSKQRPLDINIETVSFCPLSCVFCCNRLYKREKIVMDNELFEKIISEYTMRWGGTVGIGSMQSDFLSDPLLLERIRILNKYKEKLFVYSTTPLISMSKYTDDDVKLILSCFDYLEISVEGFDEKSYQIMSGINGFKTFKKQLLRLKKIIIDNSIDIKIVLLFRTYDFWKTINSEFFILCRSLFTVKNIMTEFFSWFGSIKKDDMPNGTKLLEEDNSARKIDCVVPYATLAVQSNGNVVGCGCIDWLEKNIIGNCKDSSLYDIWMGEKHKMFQTGFSRRSIPEICRNCGLYTNVDECFSKPNLLEYDSMKGPYYSI